ncbi:hypothetical protein BCR35DRAFT_263424 [Leucosporidium creatinivorum]|uniref:NodB homology domain-containing protein n=1 Tax=Leucosporidium creatinivorum TaxID=106004 RepID=A0A1Y2FWP2_9BASI|nr:hypothetical protein BCR35DRAFT_263424 [Leucosporidium creatinivorum]
MPWTLTPETNKLGYQDQVAALPRDLEGYGGQSPSNCWPDGKVIAVSFVLNYEEGAEHTPWNGDQRSTEFLHEDHYHRNPINGRDPVVESGFEYGIRCGLPRLLKLFRTFNWQFTTWACARALEVTAPYGKILVEDGHEIACHGNRWRGTADLAGPDEEAEDCTKSVQRLQAATGRKDVPTGYFTGNGSTYHRHIRSKVHNAMNVPLLYSSDTYAGDVPYYVPSPLALDGEPDEGLLMIPYSLVNNDWRFLAKGNGTGCARDWFELLVADFETLYAEGVAGQPKMMTIAMHSRVLGKPGRIVALKRFMEYIKEREGVWVCTRSEIAEVWREKYPYEVVGPTARVHQKL